MQRRSFLFLFVAFQIILLGCSAIRPVDFPGLSSSIPPDDFLKRKIAIEVSGFENYTQCPLNEFLKGMETGKWKKVDDAKWVYQIKIKDIMTNEKVDMSALFIKHPDQQDVVMFQRVVMNGNDIPEDGLLALFNLTLSEAAKVLPENSVYKTAQKAATETPAATTKPTPAQTIVPAASTPAAAPAPTVVSVTQKIKIIGNRDSKRYHLPGMKYYNAVKAHHRVEFNSEADAINAGYHKAPR